MKRVPRAHELNWFPFNSFDEPRCALFEARRKISNQTYHQKILIFAQSNLLSHCRCALFLFHPRCSTKYRAFEHCSRALLCFNSRVFIVGGIVDVRETASWPEASSSAAFIALVYKNRKQLSYLGRCASSASYPRIQKLNLPLWYMNEHLVKLRRRIRERWRVCVQLGKIVTFSIEKSLSGFLGAFCWVLFPGMQIGFGLNLKWYSIVI